MIGSNRQPVREINKFEGKGIAQRVLRDDHLLHVRKAFDDPVGLGVALVALTSENYGTTEHRIFIAALIQSSSILTN